MFVLTWKASESVTNRTGEGVGGREGMWQEEWTQFSEQGGYSKMQHIYDDHRVGLEGNWKWSNIRCHRLFKSQNFKLHSLYVADKIILQYIK